MGPTGATGATGTTTPPSLIAEAYLSSDIALTQNAEVALNTWTPTTLTAGSFSATTFIVPTTGFYSLELQVSAGNGIGHTKNGTVRRNGTYLIIGPATAGSLGVADSYVSQTQWMGSLSAGDQLTFFSTANNTGITATSGISVVRSRVRVFRW